MPSSAPDADPEVEEETNEANMDDEDEQWYDRSEFQEIVKAVEKELKATPDRTTSEEDIEFFKKKIVAVANKISKYDEAYKRHFSIVDFTLEWKNTYGQQHIPCAQFGFEKLKHYLDVIPTFQRINKNIYAIRSAQLESDSDDSSAVAPKKALSEAKEIDSGELGGSEEARGDDVVVMKNTIPKRSEKAAIKGKTVNTIRFADSDDSSSDDEEPVALKKTLSEMKKKIEPRALHDTKKACKEVVMKKRSEKAAIPAKQDILRKGQGSSSVSTEQAIVKKQTEKRRTVKRANSPDVILLDEEEPKKIPKLEIQESMETMRQEDERATVRGETRGDRGEERRMNRDEGLQQKAKNAASQLLSRASASTSTPRSEEGGGQGAHPTSASSASSVPATTTRATHSAKAITTNTTSNAKIKKEEELKRRSETAARKRPLADDSDHIHDKSDSEQEEEKTKRGAKRKSVSCKDCGKEYDKNRHEIHLKKEHGVEKPYKCKKCPAVFSEASYKRRHQKIHTPARLLRCDHCEKTFSDKSNLNRHIRVIHEEIKQHECTVCGKSFSEPFWLKEHVRIHTGERPFECSHCGKKFARKKSLKQHRISACPRDSGEDCKENQTLTGCMDSGSDEDRRLEANQVSKSDNVENTMDSEDEGVEVAMEEDGPTILSPELCVAVGKMDSGSDRDRLKEIEICKNENVENAKESVEEIVPMILCPEMRDVFPIFVNMLDIKAFMRLARTSKEMYERCTKDKSIRISVDEDRLLVRSGEDSPIFHLFSSVVRESHIGSYLAALRKLSCKVSLRTVVFDKHGEADFSVVDVVLPWLKENGVKNIKNLFFYQNFTESEAIIPLVNNFLVDNVSLDVVLPLPIKKSLLDLNVKKLSFEHPGEPGSIDFLLESASNIAEISASFNRRIEKNKLMQLISKIQSGCLRCVSVPSDVIHWDDYHKLPFDFDGPLPDERPLLLTRTTDMFRNHDDDVNERWFLHRQGNVTKCVDSDEQLTTAIYKCEPWEYPWILQEEEDILKALAEKRPRVSCTARHFRKFSSILTMPRVPLTEEIPEERPIICPVTDNLFWLLDENDSLVKCEWLNGSATWKEYFAGIYDADRIGHPALAKYVFWKLPEEGITSQKVVCCKSLEEFDSWFKGHEHIDFDYVGKLPNTRPLVFETRERNLRVVLAKDTVLECRRNRSDVCVKRCSKWNLPSVLINAQAINGMLQETLEWDFFIKEDRCVTYEDFVYGFKMFKKSALDPDDPGKPLMVYEKTTNNNDELMDERWYCCHGMIRKIIWKEGRVFLNWREDSRRSPLEIIKQLFRKYAKDKYSSTLYLHLDQFLSCLEQCNVVPFDYTGILKSDSPLAFMKKKCHYTCRKCPRGRAGSNCCNYSIHVWFLWEDMRITYCTWNKEKVSFERTSGCLAMPPILSSQEYLKCLLQAHFDDYSRYKWDGRLSDVLHILSCYTRIPNDYNGPLPPDRPLVLQTGQADVCLLLREDGTVIKCDFSQ